MRPILIVLALLIVSLTLSAQHKVYIKKATVSTEDALKIQQKYLTVEIKSKDAEFAIALLPEGDMVRTKCYNGTIILYVEPMNIVNQRQSPAYTIYTYNSDGILDRYAVHKGSKWLINKY